jgi:hypothetical protein
MFGRDLLGLALTYAVKAVAYAIVAVLLLIAYLNSN